MLTRWLTLTAFLADSVISGGAASGWGAVTFVPTCRVKGNPEVELTLNCGDGKSAGVVQYWHTPFGELDTPAFHAKHDPVFMNHDGSLVIPNCSFLHSGLYYCLLQGVNATTLWQHELHVHPNNPNQQDEQHGPINSCAAVRLSRAAPSAGVSDGLFAGAVAASVLLTFVVGFSAGALSRTHVLRCFRAVTVRLQPRQTDMPDQASQVTMTTMPSTYNTQAFESGSDFSSCGTIKMTRLTSPSPPAKPQRSFRHKRDEEAAAYLEGCDHVEEEEGDVAGDSEDETKECDGMKEEALNGGHLSEDEGNQSDEDEHSEELDDGTEGRLDGSLEEEAPSEEGSLSKEDEATSDEDREKTEEIKEREEEQPSTEAERSRKDEVTTCDDITESPPCAPIRGRRSRVIRLYQYDEDGQRYGHLPDPALKDHSPAPRRKQRSISLTRLSAIMAAASAGPLDQKEADPTESEERLQFHMEI